MPEPRLRRAGQFLAARAGRGPWPEPLVSAGPGDWCRVLDRRLPVLHVLPGHEGAAQVGLVDAAEFVGGLGVLRDVDARQLVLLGDPETHRLVDDLAEDPGDGEGVEADRDR